MSKAVQWIISVVVGLVSSFFHQYGLMLGFMIGAIAFDVLTGLIKSGKEGKINKVKGWDGFWKKMALLVAFAFGVFMDAMIPALLLKMGVDIPINIPFSLTIVTYICLNESISICENIYEINPQALPGWIVKLLINGKSKIDDMVKSKKEE